ncbi:MAG TPA: ankyrin repeat domain-containing protein [Thermoanaerobaculia bacterium]|nr:ankyrin repeat domain-containing protein [Thermoanaerobaculia bacterium]
MAVSTSLPERASLDYLKKLAKERLRELRTADPAAKLSTAQLAIAREHGFSSWRALKAEIDRRRVPRLGDFFAACQAGAVPTLKALLAAEPQLVRERDPAGSTGLHLAVAHPDCVRLLLVHGADPNARDRGDNAYALHFAAAGGYLESVRALLDADGDVHGLGDVHQADVIGWAVGDGRNVPHDVVALLIDRGARHHVFSAIAMGDMELVRAIVEENPDALARRRSRFEQGQTPLHYALAAPNGLQPKTAQYDMADLLIELGADLEAEDDNGRTPLAVAMLHGDLEAMRRLEAAGAKEPKVIDPSSLEERVDALRNSMRKQVTPMLCVEDVDATVAWYTSLGFTLRARHPEVGEMDWAALSFGKTELMIQSRGSRPHNQIALWFHTSKVEGLYELMKSRQLKAAQEALAGDAVTGPAINFLEDLYDPFYGGRQFSVSDLNGLELVFTST